MKIKEVDDFFQDLLKKIDNKSERKIYQTFRAILSDLHKRGLTESQLYAIENELESLQLTAPADNQKKYIKKKLAAFESYLEKEFSLIKEEHYQNTGIALGMSLGMLAGVIFGPLLGMDSGLVMGMCVGLIIGMIIGQNKDKEAKRENRVMKVKLE